MSIGHHTQHNSLNNKSNRVASLHPTLFLYCREDWVNKFGTGMFQRRDWEGNEKQLTIGVDESRYSDGAPLSTMSGMTTAKSQTFSRNAFVGKGKGLGGVLAPPMQGASFPHSVQSQSRSRGRGGGHRHEDSVMFSPNSHNNADASFESTFGGVGSGSVQLLFHLRLL